MEVCMCVYGKLCKLREMRGERERERERERREMMYSHSILHLNQPGTVPFNSN